MIEEVERKFRKMAEYAEDKEIVDPDPIIKPADADIYAQVTNFFSFLKFGDNSAWHGEDEIDEYFDSEDGDLSYCVFPLLKILLELITKKLTRQF